MNADTPRAVRVAGSVRAKRQERAAERGVRDPLLRAAHVPAVARLSAEVTSEPASDPAPGSVSAKQPICSPCASGGTNSAICASVPNARIGSVHALVCTATVTPTPASARESSSSTRMYDMKSAPAPPCSSGTQTPSRPELRELVEQLAREPVRAIPLGRVRLDLGGGELARDRLDLALLRRELEVHARQTTPMKRIRDPGADCSCSRRCGGHSARSAEDTARAWSAALNASDNEAAANQFAPSRRSSRTASSCCGRIATRFDGTRGCRAAAASPASSSSERTRCSSCSG